MQIISGYNFVFGCLCCAVIVEDVRTSAINGAPKISVGRNSTILANDRSFGNTKEKIFVINKTYQNWNFVGKLPLQNALSENGQNRTCIEKYRCNTITLKLNKNVNKNPEVNFTADNSNQQIIISNNKTEKNTEIKRKDKIDEGKTKENTKVENNSKKFRTKRQIIQGPRLKLNTTIGGSRRQDRLIATPGSNLTVEFKECGFVFCFAEDFHLNNSIHRWDYHVEWSIPNVVKENVHADRIFVLGDHFQMAHAYLVFRRFDKSYEGEYICRLTLFGKTVVDVHVNLVFSSALSSKQCITGIE